MATFEEEYKRIEPLVLRWVAFLLFGKKIEVRQADNFVLEGPNIIVGNHCGAFKDVATLFRIAPRCLFFTANKDIFTKEAFDRLIRKHLVRHLKDFGLVVNQSIKPLKYLFIRFISANIAKVGTIPVDLESSRREAMRLCEDYLRQSRAVVALQGRGRINPKAPHPYISPFKKGASILVYSLYRDYGISVPVTPLAIYGTQTLWGIPGKISVNIGEPMYIDSYLGGDFGNCIEAFRNALEARVRSLFIELIRT